MGDSMGRRSSELGSSLAPRMNCEMFNKAASIDLIPSQHCLHSLQFSCLLINCDDGMVQKGELPNNLKANLRGKVLHRHIFLSDIPPLQNE